MDIGVWACSRTPENRTLEHRPPEHPKAKKNPELHLKSETPLRKPGRLPQKPGKVGKSVTRKDLQVKSPTRVFRASTR